MTETHSRGSYRATSIASASTDARRQRPSALLRRAAESSAFSDFDLHLFGEGRHWRIYSLMGAHPRTVDGVRGYHFAVWAPNARQVSVVGDFNQWDGNAARLRSIGRSGVWERFVPGLEGGELYKYRIAD